MGKYVVGVEPMENYHLQIGSPSAPSNLLVSFRLLFSLLQFLSMGLIPSITMLGFLHLFSVKVKKKIYSTAPAHHKMANTQITEEPDISLSSC